MEHPFKTAKFGLGDRVIYRGSFGAGEQTGATIVGLGFKNGELVYDLDDHHWCYEEQIIHLVEKARKPDLITQDDLRRANTGKTDGIVATGFTTPPPAPDPKSFVTLGGGDAVAKDLQAAGIVSPIDLGLPEGVEAFGFNPLPPARRKVIPIREAKFNVEVNEAELMLLREALSFARQHWNAVAPKKAAALLPLIDRVGRPR